MVEPDPNKRIIALALSGGGSRAIAFHLGGLRALHDLGLLDDITVLSTVSGGSVIGALFAYSDLPFPAFEQRVISILKRGLQGLILRKMFFSSQTPALLATYAMAVLAGLLTTVCRTLGRVAGFLSLRRMSHACEKLAASLADFPVWATATTALEAVLDNMLGGVSLPDVRRPGLEVVINCTEMQTATAFRFGSRTSGGWRFGKIAENGEIRVARAVAASAAYPLFLPFTAETYPFDNRGEIAKRKVVLSDGGIYDNLGVSAVVPGRSGDHSVHLFDPTHIISMNASTGQWDSTAAPFWIIGRAQTAFEVVHRKAQDSWYERLHHYVSRGELNRFLMVYLGQIDEKLPVIPPDLVPRLAVRDYPTDFAPMESNDITRLSRRGEQLTRILYERYW